MLSPRTEPTASQLRWFGASLAVMLGLFAALARWSWELPLLAAALLVAAVLLAVIYYGVPSSRRAIIAGFLWITWPLQALVSLVVLWLLYYGIIAPIGLGLRLIGKDPLSKRPDPQCDTYWVPVRPTNDARRYFRLF
jgi:hypothetical protein